MAAPEQQTGGNLRLSTEEQDPDDAEYDRKLAETRYNKPRGGGGDAGFCQNLN